MLTTYSHVDQRKHCSIPHFTVSKVKRGMRKRKKREREET
jgi:hypothetical protein